MILLTFLRVSGTVSQSRRSSYSGWRCRVEDGLAGSLHRDAPKLDNPGIDQESDASQRSSCRDAINHLCTVCAACRHAMPIPSRVCRVTTCSSIIRGSRILRASGSFARPNQTQQRHSASSHSSFIANYSSLPVHFVTQHHIASVSAYSHIQTRP